MQLAMDIRLASTEARYGFVFARRGLNPEAASSWFLPHLVGPQTALEWCFTGRVFPASEAKEKGLVRSLHAPDELLPAARALAREIADNTAPVSVAITRQLIWRMAGAAHPMEAHMADSRGIQLRGAQARRARGRQLVPGEAGAGLPRQGLRRPAGHLAALERADVPLRLVNEALTGRQHRVDCQRLVDRRLAMDAETTTAFDANCSFCRKSHVEVETLIGAIGVFICNECVDVANDSLAKVRAARDPSAPRVPFDYPAQLRGAQSEKLLRLVGRGRAAAPGRRRLPGPERRDPARARRQLGRDRRGARRQPPGGLEALRQGTGNRLTRSRLSRLTTG